jgi:tetratricopeptide (TPR) repeat protein
VTDRDDVPSSSTASSAAADPAVPTTAADRAAVVDTRPMRDPKALRMPPRSENPEPLPPLARLRGTSDGLELVDADDVDTGLKLPEGALGDIERMLGEARPVEALAAIDVAALDDEMRATLRARAYLMDGRTDDARAALADRDRDGVALGDAALALAEGDLDRADRRVRAVLDADPTSIGAAYLQALVRVSRGDMAQGAELLGAVARTQPTHAVARFQLGQILFAQGDPARAGTLYEMAWELQPAFVSPPLALADMLVESRQYGEALGILERVCAAAPSSLPPRQLQLRILVEIGEREAALELGRALHEQVPDDADTALLFADALVDADRGDEANALLTTLLQGSLDATHAIRARRLQARVALADRRVDDALKILRDAVDGASPALVGEVALELAQIAAAQRRMAELDVGLVAMLRSTDLGSLVSGALLARQHGLSLRAKALAERAKSLVPGTAAANQLDGFIASL